MTRSNYIMQLIIHLIINHTKHTKYDKYLISKLYNLKIFKKYDINYKIVLSIIKLLY